MGRREKERERGELKKRKSRAARCVSRGLQDEFPHFELHSFHSSNVAPVATKTYQNLLQPNPTPKT